MKNLSLVLTLAALALPQAGQATTWFRTYGGSAQDKGYCVQVTKDSNYIVSGYKGNDLWLLKVDTSGEKIWERTYGGKPGTWIEQTIDGGFIVAGSLKLLKTNSQGDSLWMRDIGINSFCVQQTSDNGFIVLGENQGFPRYIKLLKTSSAGDSIWMKTYLLDGWVYSRGYFVRQTADKGFIVAGLLGDTLYGEERAAFWLFKTDSLGNPLWNYTQGGNEWGDYNGGNCVQQIITNDYVALANFGLLKFNQAGDTLWTRNYAGGEHFQEITNSDFILTGEIETNLLYEGITPLNNVWLFKVDNEGDSLWERTYSGGFSYCVAETPDKGFIATGVQGGDLFLLKTDSLGLLGISENPIVETDNGWNVPHSIGSYVVLHYKDLPQGFHANVFDVSGRKVDHITGDGNEGAMTWGINYPPGVYFIQALDNQNQLKTAKVVLVR